MIRLAVCGACGRMGRRIVALAAESKEFEIAAALERPGHDLCGQDIGIVAGIGQIGVAVMDDLKVDCDVMIAFSTPAGTEAWAQYCGDKQIPLVVGTTGLSDAQKEKLQMIAQKIPLLIGANMSLGVNLLFKLIGQVAQRLGEDYDIEVTETHHRFKRDAPSGTALELARQIAGAKDWPWPDCMVHGRQGKDVLRQEKTIGMHALRAGDTVGMHEIIFSALGETVKLAHSAHTRDTFVRGALRAAQWLCRQKPGIYGMADVLGL